MQLAGFIEAEKEAIVEQAVAFARTLAVLSAADLAQLRNHIPQILQSIADDLNTAQSESASIARSHGQAAAAHLHSEADEHGLQRARVGLSIEQVLAEYRALRSSVVRLWGAHPSAAEHDVQEIQRFNEAIDQAIAESVRAFVSETERRRQLFLAALGHDLRGPLNAVSLSTAALRHNGPPHIGRFVDVISRSVQRMGKLLGSLLDYNLVGLGGRMVLTTSTVNLDRECEEELEILRAANPGARIELEVAGDCRGVFDESRVREALGNLVSNAVRHGVSSSPIQVQVTGSDNTVELTVTNAVESAICDSELALLFEPMRRGTGNSSRRADDRSSLGLGLFITKEIAQAHGGAVKAVCHNELVSFSMSLPKTSALPDQPSA
jgi:signal transduction histidine kinase